MGNETLHEAPALHFRRSFRFLCFRNAQSVDLPNSFDGSTKCGKSCGQAMRCTPCVPLYPSFTTGSALCTRS